MAKIVLKCSDDAEFEVDEAVAFQSRILKHVIEDAYSGNIPLPKVTGPILAKIVLKCSDAAEFEIDEAVAFQSRILKHVIEDVYSGIIPLPKVTGPILVKVIQYCERHASAADASEEDLRSFDDHFAKVDLDTLYDLMSRHAFAADASEENLRSVDDHLAKVDLEMLYDLMSTVLKCSDDAEFEVDEAVAFQSRILKHVIEDAYSGNIPLPKVTGPILAKVIQYCERHASATDTLEEDLRSFGDHFAKVDLDTLYDLMSVRLFMAKIVLKYSNASVFEVDEAVAFQSRILKHVIEDVYSGIIPLPKVTGPILVKVIQYYERHASAADASEEDLRSFDDHFAKVNMETLYDLMSIVLKCSDDAKFEVDEAVAFQSQILKHVIEDSYSGNIPLPKVTGPILAKSFFLINET
ncbi:hypothetical protein ACS0TY_016640 [Phlomoides rotata]